MINNQSKVPPSRENFVYAMLKEAILSGELKPSDTVNQTDVASKLGVSPIPVRAAISRLIAEGLMTQEPHHSPHVSNLSYSDLDEILAIRMHLEEMATRLAVPHINSDGIAKLNDLIDQMGVALEARELHRFGSLNREFHLAIYHYCPYQLLNQMIQDLWDRADMNRSRSMFSLIPGLAEESYKEHIELLKLIQDGQAEAAVTLINRHKTRARVKLMESTVPDASKPEKIELANEEPAASVGSST